MIRHYRYKAISSSGKKVTGLYPAASDSEAINYLNSRNLCILELREAQYRNLFRLPIMISILEKFGYRAFGNKDLMIFCRQLATMLESGITLIYALKILSSQIDNYVFRTRINKVLQQVEQGDSFSSALAKDSNNFPPLLISMVKTGETAGALGSIMERMADHYEKQHDLEEKLKAATAYPLFISAVAMTVMIIMIVFVLPQFANVFGSFGMEMPLFSRIMLLIGKIISDHWYFFMLMPLLALLVFRILIGNAKGKFFINRLQLNMPIFGRIYKQTLTARFARSLCTLLNSGITLHQSLKMVAGVVDNAVISQSLADVDRALINGDNLSGPLRETHCFPPLLVEMIKVGEESGALDYTLNKTALFYEREVAYQVERLGSLIEPILLLLVGLFIGLIVYSVMSPMYQVFQII